MRSENDTPIDQRYLTIAGTLSKERFNREKQSAIKFCTEFPDRLSESNKEALEMLATFSLSENYRAFIIMSCYADIPPFRSYGKIFKITDHSIHISTTAILQFGIFWHKLPILSLEHGHHQVAIFNFPDDVPPIIETLPINNVEGSITSCLGLKD